MDLSRERTFFPPSLLDQSFGLCITPEDLIFPSYNFHRTSYYRPWKWYMQRAEKDFGSTIQDEKEKFKIALDVQHFQPDEINVKVADREVIIEGKHEERQDNHGFISRQFRRRYFLPHDCNPDSVFSSLSSDGVLTVTADKMKELKNKEIIVPIKMCESCPNKDFKMMEKKEVTESITKSDGEASKKRMEIMLKEDHCCLLRPELLGTSADKIPTKKQVEDVLCQTSTEKLDQATNIKVTEKIDVASAQTSAAKVEKGAECELTSAGKTQTVASDITAGKSETVACGLTSSGKVDTMSSGMTSTGKAEKADALLCGLSSAGKAEISETLLCGLSATTAGKSEQTEAVACGITSEVLTEKAETRGAAISEMSNIKSMLNEKIQIQESSSSYSSSLMASSIRETSEKISEIVSDISAQLKEAAENI